MPEENAAAEVTAAEVARLAGVGRAAVSNWRRRHADFPKPVGGTETSPSFSLDEVEHWLRAQGKLAEVPPRERVWQQIAAHPGGAVVALVQAGGALLVVRDRPADWLELTAVSDARMATLLRPVLDQVLGARLGPGHALAEIPLRPAAMPLLRAAAELAAELGARQAFEFLLGRHLDANPRQYTLTPDGLAGLMAALAGPSGASTGSTGAAGAAPFRVLDPACGTGTLLRAVRGATALYAQDSAPELAALAALRLALNGTPQVRAAAADSLRADAFAQDTVDAVLCHPPFNERAWGHEELAYDPRWEYGFPARTESELAWVQHALAHLREGGTAVLLMPPAVAARRSGRRIRADLLRRGALRAVVALPAGAAPPYGIPLHLWVLRRPAPHAAPPAGLLLIDTAALAADAQLRSAWPAVHEAVQDAWSAYDRTGSVARAPGVSRVVPVIELLDDDVDLTPARHLPPPTAGGGPAELTAVRERLGETLGRAARLTPPAAAAPAGGTVRPPMTTVGELARAGALELHTGTGGGTGSAPVLTEQDVYTGSGPSGTLAPTADEPVLTAPGDVLVPLVGGAAIARVVDEATAGAVPGRGLALLRPDPDALDPWFLAGFLRGTANTRRASSHASTATRLDVRRLRLPRLPLAQQQGYGLRFQALAEFEDALRLAGRLGEQLVQGFHDGLSDGTVTPE
ncbi:HsdM family class I SAM-dependent methyltransferase [Streptomyces virginiae]|uniref:HsdM family class I SAM-dependent methyltransferase n=1 Tax=Streptomyces virginiae TaxID=1961 RepID=UPI00224F10E0|nr:N-6 DNA methylase [Streptomyces virginiae]MCX4963124.1 SAM-dependent methyltransferase [Streptomyces virginiae]